MDFKQTQLVQFGNNLFDPNKINYATITYPDPDLDQDQNIVCTLYFVGSRFPIECKDDQALMLWNWLKANYMVMDVELPTTDTQKAFEVVTA